MAPSTPRTLRRRPSDASDVSAGSHSRGRSRLQQLAKRRPSPPKPLTDQGPSVEGEEMEKKLADMESLDSSEEEQESMGNVDSGSGNDSEDDDEDDEFKAKPDKISKYVPQAKKEKPKVLKMVVLSCKICGKSSKVVKWSAFLSGVGVDDKLMEIPDGPLCWPCSLTCKVWPKEERSVINALTC